MRDKLKRLLDRLRPAQVSIRFYIIGIMVIFCVVVFAAIWLFQIVFLGDFYRSIKTEAIKKTADQLSELTGTLTLDNTLSDTEFNEKVQDISFENDACSLIVNVDTGYGMGPRSKANCPIAEVTDFSVNTLYNLAKEHGGSVTLYANGEQRLDISQLQLEYRKSDRKGLEDIVYAKAGTDASGAPILILLSTIIRPVDVVADTLTIQMRNIIMIVLLLSILVSLLLTKIIAKPIAKINDQANKLAKGDYSPVFAGNGYKEAAQLSGTLNYAAVELSKVDKLRADLIANVSHDLRTPLTMISGYGEVMRDIPGENTPENVQIIIDEANRLTSMVNNLLDISKLQSGNAELEPSETDLTELIREIVSRYQKMMEKEGFRITFAAAEEVIAVVDPTRISQVIYNLLNNAINYSEEDKRIEVAQSSAGGLVRIDIRDHGIGVKPEDLPAIWDRYYRVDKEHKRTVTGSGLGLSIVKTILEKHQAKYGVESTYGSGSDFWFAIPYKEKKRQG